MNDFHPSVPRDPLKPAASLATFTQQLAAVLSGSTGWFETAGQLLAAFVDCTGTASATLIAQQRGVWMPRIHCDGSGNVTAMPDGPPLPEALIAEAVDANGFRTDGSWCVLPYQTDRRQHSGAMDSGSRVGCLLYHPVSSADRVSSPDRAGTDAVATPLIAQLLVATIVRAEREQQSRVRIEQLTSVLEAAATWQQTQLQQDSDENTLLRQIADTATELTGSQRASIFLWDKRRKKLIGRPALGIDGEALVVPDDAGVVGEVLATQEPQIWNADSDDESRVNREVDRTHSFDTRSLVAVPLIGPRGDTIGVFEALNHHDNCFDASHAELLSDLATHAAVAIQAARVQRSLTESRDRLVRDAASSSPLIGEHPGVVAVRESGTKVAKTDLTVLILGSNGTGKEIVARHIHFESDRRHGPFMAVNCAALVESLLESELFGHEKGSFTDAGATRAGKFELASGGTLFLDEVGDMSQGGQAKLLRVLEQREVVRVGGSTPIPVDVRVIAATNQPLETLIAERRFREDLFFRLNVVSLSLPDLARRGRDVLLLAEHFLKHFSYEIGRPVPKLAESAQSALLGHPWPGNVRELRNTIERVCYLTTDNVIQASDLELRSAIGQAGHQRSGITHGTLPDSLAESTRLFQIDHIRDAIAQCDGNMTEAAARLDLHRSNLYRKMKQLGMRVEDDA